MLAVKQIRIFLEVNPVGQWLWLEKLVGMDISQEVARVLSAQADSSCR
jgi:hypothetical protein